MRAACALALFLAGPAAAGPGTTVHIRDALFGISEDRIFLLRRASDNYTSHHVDIQSVALIEIDRKTGAEIIWPVSRTRFNLPLSNDDAVPDIIRMELPGAINPFTKLAEQGATPLLGATGALPVENPQSTMHTGDGLLLSWPDMPQTPDGRALFNAILDPQGFLTAGDASVAAFLTAMDYERNDVRRFADLGDLVGFAGSDCHIPRIWGITGQPVALTQTHCNEEDGSSFTQIQVLPGWTN